MAYKQKSKKPLNKWQSAVLMEIMRNHTSLKGNEIMALRRKLKERRLMRKGDYA
jgi:hypothetical protein